MQLLMLNTVFLGGLREEIRNRVLEDGPTNPDDSVKAARDIESIINDKRKEKGFHVTSIEGPPEEEEAEDVGEVDEQEAAQLREVNAILRTIPRPREAAEEAVDALRPLKRSPTGKTPIIL